MTTPTIEPIADPHATPGDPDYIKSILDALSNYPAKIFTVGELYLMFSCPASIHAQRQLEALILWAQKEQF